MKLLIATINFVERCHSIRNARERGGGEGEKVARRKIDGNQREVIKSEAKRRSQQSVKIFNYLFDKCGEWRA